MEKITIEQARSLATILEVYDPVAVMEGFNAAVGIANGETDEKLTGWEQDIKNNGLVPPISK